MAFCKNCGQQIADGVGFCPACGTPVEGAAQQNTQQATPVQGVPMTQQDADVQSSRGIAWLSYVGLLFLIPMFVKKDSPYCQFHVKEGVTLCACEIALYIVNAIMSAIFNAASLYVLGFIFGLIVWAAEIFLFVVAIIGIVHAAKGEKVELPLIGKITVLKDVWTKVFASLNK